MLASEQCEPDGNLCQVKGHGVIWEAMYSVILVYNLADVSLGAIPLGPKRGGSALPISVCTPPH